MTDRQLDCLLAAILFRYHDEGGHVQEDKLVDRYGERPVPNFVTDWTAFGLALDLIWKLDYSVELFMPACSDDARAVVSPRAGGTWRRVPHELTTGSGYCGYFPNAVIA